MSSEIVKIAVNWSALLKTPVSFGMNIKEPDWLETRQIGEVLVEIKDGRWRLKIKHLRSCSGTEQANAALALPYFIPAGEFSYRNNDSLVRYSGLVMIHLDDLPPQRLSRISQTASDDEHCLAGFRSPTGQGLKLLFRVSRQLGHYHKEIFPQVVDHVWKRYPVERNQINNLAGVSQACFVSWDNKAWIYTEATELPIVISA